MPTRMWGAGKKMVPSTPHLIHSPRLWRPWAKDAVILVAVLGVSEITEGDIGALGGREASSLKKEPGGKTIVT